MFKKTYVNSMYRHYLSLCSLAQENMVLAGLRDLVHVCYEL